MSTDGNLGKPFELGLQQDLESARVLLEDLPWRDNPQRYRKVAEAIIRRTLGIDPENEYARALLAKAEAPMPDVVLPPSSPSPPAPVRSVTPPAAPARRPVNPPPASDFSFVVQSAKKSKPEQNRQPKRRASSLAAIAALCGIGGLVVFANHFNTLKTQYIPKTVVAAPPSVADQENRTAGRPAPVVSVVPQPVDISVPVSDKPIYSAAVQQAADKLIAAAAAASAGAAATAGPAAPFAKTDAVEATSATPPAALPLTGKLAVSSPTTVDIYLDDKFVGSAPATLELPAGTHNIEYRHLDMRKVQAHVVKPAETSTVMITFEIAVQINARPWAQVFIEGSQRQPLGQTPLSDVRVPIGSVLVFENPNFREKSYRVTGKETEIRVTLP